MEQKTEVKKRGKENGYSNAVLRAKRNRKRNEAEARDVAYQALSVSNRIELAKSRRGESKREIARLQKLLETSKKGTNVTK